MKLILKNDQKICDLAKDGNYLLTMNPLLKNIICFDILQEELS